MAFAVLTPEVEARVHKFKADGLTTAEIAMILRLPYSLVRNLLAPPAWPKVFTRIDEDGAWKIVRES